MSKTTLKRPRPAADDPISSGRRTQHISRACAGCRGRKYRCDDQVPACGQCTTRNIECIRSVRVDKRRALTKAEVEELNDNIQQLEDVQRCMKNDNELLKYQISWLMEELRKHGVANLDIPTKLPSSPALPHLSPDSSPSLSPYLPFLLSPATPAGSLPVDSPVDNKGLMPHSDPQLFSADYLPYSLSGSLPDNGMYLSPMYTSGRPSTTSLPHPIPAFNAGFSTATNDYAGIHARAIPHSAPPMLHTHRVQ
ncbi:hypothetical protein EXIGLDRAFT_441561 [Exidia glandulosa HHB12029]|uniref:Zn(2)-C6 fungal-type domain-containing protein n=1 Tax=Exidia glandulosa HHB12029 TaxID=1314781 RepID=A0A165KAW9_EXIGL|nr:hypothetical protein EXIGLDRAFT_441561 [Exidia glandulosa HHB12029]